MALEDVIDLELQAADKLQEVQDDMNSAAKNLRVEREKLYKRRQELVTGKSLPTQNELQQYEEEHPHGDAAGSTSIKGVPYFWLTVLCNQDTLADEISSRDKQALSYCTSVRPVYSSKGGPPVIEFSFSSNPFFHNSMLKRCLGDASRQVDEVTTEIDWKDAEHKLTVKEVSKKSGKKGKGKGQKNKGSSGDNNVEETAGKAKYKACSSFFQFFMADSSSSKQAVHPSALPFTHADEDDEEDDGEAEKSPKQEKDELLTAVLLEEVFPKATTLYISGPLQAPSDEDDEGSDFQVVHGPVSEHASDLPAVTQKVLAALQHNQAQLDTLAEQWQRQRSKLKADQSKIRAQLAEDRRSLLVSAEALETEVPRFWLRVLKSADAAALAISPRDAAVLAALADVRFSMDASATDSEIHGKWELEFLPNEYLVAAAGAANKRPLLVKSYTFERGAGADRLLQSKVVAAPSWTAPNKDPTHKIGRDGKQRAASSIFQLFKQGGGKYAFNLTGSGKDVQEEANELETELLQELFSHLLLQAGQVYKERQGGGWHDEDSAEEDQRAWDTAADADVESEGYTDDELDEAEAAHQAAVRRSKQRRSWTPTKSEVLIFLVAMMLLGELFVFLDMAGLFKRR